MTTKCGNISGVILAGGENRRFGGKNKAKSFVGGERIIDRIMNTIGEIFDEIIIVTNTPGEFSDIPNCKIVVDYFKGVGPLGGIHSAILNSSKDAVFVFAGDMPFLSQKLILKQIEFYYRNHSNAVIPESNKKIEPLHSIYKCSLLSALEEHLNNTEDYNIRQFIGKINAAIYKPRGREEVIRVFTNINTQQDATAYDQINK